MRLLDISIFNEDKALNLKALEDFGGGPPGGSARNYVFSGTFFLDNFITFITLILF